MLGLVLTAGGARGAYQAGVLKRIGQLAALRDRPSPFAIITGASAGAINGTMLAARSAQFHDATSVLADLWAQVEMKQVVRTGAASLTIGGLRWLRDLSLGGFLVGAGARALLDATPLRDLIARNLPFGRIAEAIQRGHLYAIAISATSYHSGRSFTFVQGRDGHPIWVKSRRVVLPVELGVEHVCASASIPIIFPPVAIDCGGGELFFGDGSLRLVSPFSAAIRLGARRVLAIGIRSQRSADALSRTETFAGERAASGSGTLTEPPLAQICGIFLNAIFLDHLDTDFDHLTRMNELIIAYGGDTATPTAPTAPVNVSEPMRVVMPMVVNPSEDLAMVAKAHEHKMPRLIRHLMDGLGTPEAHSADLLSYLLFDSAYTRALVDIGYRDANERRDEIEAFLCTRSASEAA
jgi:NTE family protein